MVSRWWSWGLHYFHAGAGGTGFLGILAWRDDSNKSLFVVACVFSDRGGGVWVAFRMGLWVLAFLMREVYLDDTQRYPRVLLVEVSPTVYWQLK